jgi:hypothetical protein
MPGPDPRTRRTKREKPQTTEDLKQRKRDELGEIITKDGKNILIIDPKMFNKDGTMNFAKGGRAGFKAGSKGCKLAKRGRGRAYGKNS